jgi:hypothetical protein
MALRRINRGRRYVSVQTNVLEGPCVISIASMAFNLGRMDAQFAAVNQKVS